MNRLPTTRALAYLLALMLLFTTLAACGKQEKEPDITEHTIQISQPESSSSRDESSSQPETPEEEEEDGEEEETAAVSQQEPPPEPPPASEPEPAPAPDPEPEPPEESSEPETPSTASGGARSITLPGSGSFTIQQALTNSGVGGSSEIEALVMTVFPGGNTIRIEDEAVIAQAWSLMGQVLLDSVDEDDSAAERGTDIVCLFADGTTTTIFMGGGVVAIGEGGQRMNVADSSSTAALAAIYYSNGGTI